MTAMAASAAGAARPRFRAVREFGTAVGTIMVKELRSRMRGRRAFVVLTIYLAVLAAITYAIYLMTYSTVAAMQSLGGGIPGAAVNASAAIGQGIFTALSLLQILLVSFMAPAFTAGAISLEREKQTLDLLVSTPLRPGAVVVGKLLAALAFVFLMILAAIPLTAIVLMYGGAALDDVLRQQVVLFIAAIGFGSIGILFSALLKRTQAATVLTYSTVLALTLGTGFLFVFWTVMVTGPGDPTVRRRAPEAILYLNPFVAMADVIANTEQPGSGGIGTMLLEVRGIDPFGTSAVGAGGFETICEPNGVCRDVPIGGAVDFACPPGVPCPMPDVIDPIGRPVPAPDREPPAAGYFWPRFAITFAVLSGLLTLVSMRLVVPAGMRFAFRRRAAASRAGEARHDEVFEDQARDAPPTAGAEAKG